MLPGEKRFSPALADSGGRSTASDCIINVRTTKTKPNLLDNSSRLRCFASTPSLPTNAGLNGRLDIIFLNIIFYFLDILSRINFSTIIMFNTIALSENRLLVIMITL